MDKKQLSLIINQCIVQLVSMVNEMYRQIVPVWMLGRMAVNYEILCNALNGFRFIAENLDNGSFTEKQALEFTLKQLEIINAIE